MKILLLITSTALAQAALTGGFALSGGFAHEDNTVVQATSTVAVTQENPDLTGGFAISNGVTTIVSDVSNDTTNTTTEGGFATGGNGITGSGGITGGRGGITGQGGITGNGGGITGAQ